MSIEVRQVSYGYENAPEAALQEVSFSVEQGSLALLVGVSGSGKTTLLRLIAGLEQPDNGSLAVNGTEPMSGDVGLLFQSSEMQLFAATVQEDVMFGPLNQGLSKTQAGERARTAMSAVGIPESYANASPFLLSGGMMRRVAIAGVLALDCDTYLFDEPFAGLDGRGQAFMLDLLASLKQQGKTVIVVSHDVETMLNVADSVLVLSQGKLVWQGSPQSLADNAATLEEVGLVEPPVVAFKREMNRLITNHEGSSL